ncbi:MAG: diacylglycerol kinase family protein [Pseudomonadota bacterium]
MTGVDSTIMKRPDITVIFNPRAGRTSRRYLASILDLLKEPAMVIETTRPGHARDIASNMPAGVRLFVAGGDGTINEVVNGLIDARKAGRDIPPMGIIPMGTANVLAFEIGLDMRPASMMAYLQDGLRTDVRPGLVNGRAFMLMTGVGTDAQTVADVSPALKRRIGKWAYVWQGLTTILHGPRRTFSVAIDGRAFDAASVIVTRTIHYAGKYVLSPQSGLAHDNLHVVIMPSLGRKAQLRYALSLLCGRLAQQNDVMIVPATTIIIDANDRHAPLQIDGEAAGGMPTRIGLSEHVITLITPGPGTANTF